MPKNTTQSVMGIDIGLDGAIAVIRNRKSKIIPMPTYWSQIGKKRRRRIKERDIFACFQKELPDLVAIEVPYVSPSVSKLSISSLFYQYGFMVGVVRTLELSYHLIPPKEWQKHFGISAKQTKQQSMVVAARLYPKLKIEKDGIADALLIATYALNKFPNSL